MVDQSYNLRAGDAGPEVQGTPGHVLTFQSDGRVKGEAPATSLPSAIRAQWSVSDQASAITFAPDQPAGGARDIITEVGALIGLTTDMRLFVQPTNALVGGFHSGSPAPEFGGVYDVLSTDGDSSAVVQRSAVMATSAQIAALAIIAVDGGGNPGVFQVATPATAVVDTDPQVIPQVGAPLSSGGNQALTSFGGEAHWQAGVIAPDLPTNAGTYALQYDFGTSTLAWVLLP